MTLDGINIQDNFIRTGGLNFQPNLLLLDQISEFTILDLEHKRHVSAAVLHRG